MSGKNFGSLMGRRDRHRAFADAAWADDRDKPGIRQLRTELHNVDFATDHPAELRGKIGMWKRIRLSAITNAGQCLCGGSNKAVAPSRNRGDVSRAVHSIAKGLS